MKNCLVAQSGGPTSVINASVVGIIEENKKLKAYNKVYAGLNGIEGILDKRIIDLSGLTDEEVDLFKYTPSSGLGSCRYKIKDFQYDDEEYVRFFAILDSLDIETFFYIGGNDSMDTVSKLSSYAELKGLKKKIIGIPKTIDNDLQYTDHTPGYGSAAKYIASLVLETYLDASVYVNNGIFIMETMGRDTGWLAASAALAQINGQQLADFIYLPEVAFSEEDFLRDVRERFEARNKVYIVASEGLKDKDGHYLHDNKLAKGHDSFSHAQLGGLGNYLQGLIKEAGISQRVKVLELGVAQRSAMHLASNTDIEEACLAGRAGLRYSLEAGSGFMVAFNRLGNQPYALETGKVEAARVANEIKYFPREWILDRNQGVSKEALEYMEPLVRGEANVRLKNGLPNFINIVDRLKKID